MTNIENENVLLELKSDISLIVKDSNTLCDCIFLTGDDGMVIQEGSIRFDGAKIVFNLYINDRVAALVFMTGNEDINYDNIVIMTDIGNLTISQVIQSVRLRKKYFITYDKEAIRRTSIEKIALDTEKAAEGIKSIADSLTASDVKEYNWNVKKHIRKELYGIDVDSYCNLLRHKKAMLIYGVPGTGKSTTMLEIANKICNGDENRYSVVSFHSDYTSSDFICGIQSINGKWQNTDGILMKMCKKANEDDKEYVLCIDEISRGNAASIFGELISAIEMRGQLFTLSNGQSIVIPDNLYIIATANNKDENAIKLDEALRQRMAQVLLEPNWSEEYMIALSQGNNKLSAKLIEIAKIMVGLNNTIKNDSALSEDDIIGTRGVVMNNPSEEELKDKVYTELLKSIENSTMYSTSATKDDAQSAIKRIGEIVNG